MAYGFSSRKNEKKKKIGIKTCFFHKIYGNILIQYFFLCNIMCKIITKKKGKKENMNLSSDYGGW
jgi:hypothetical protein